MTTTFQLAGFLIWAGRHSLNKCSPLAVRFLHPPGCILTPTASPPLNYSISYWFLFDWYVAPLILLCILTTPYLSGLKPLYEVMLGITCRQSMPPERRAGMPPLNTYAMLTTFTMDLLDNYVR